MSPREALVAALDAAHRAGTPAPCAPTPDAAHASTWDDIPHSGPGKARAIQARITACRTRCPAFTECEALRRHESSQGLKPFGVIAGRVHGISNGGPGTGTPRTDFGTYTPAQRDAALADYLTGKTAVQVAADHSLPPNTVRNWIRQANISRPRRPRSGPKHHSPQVREACVTAYVNGARYPEISATHGVPVETIKTWAQKAGVTRTHAEGIRLRDQKAAS